MTEPRIPNSDDVRSARLFRNGRSQAVRIPKEFELDGKDVTIRRDGEGRLIVEGVQQRRTPAEFIQALRDMPPTDEPWEEPTDDDLLPLDEIDL